MLTRMYTYVHPQAAVAITSEENLRKEIDKCCPPPKESPRCSYEPCKAEKQMDPPPKDSEPTPIH